MNRFAKALVVLSGLLLVGSPAAWAEEEDIRADIDEMRQLVKTLQSQVSAQSEQLSHQGEQLRDYQAREEERTGESGISSFLDSLVIEGWVAASYWYNFNDSGFGESGFFTGGNNVGVSGNVYPFHPDHNTFQVDQVWFGLEKPVSEESRGGFRFDILYGKTACFVGTSTGIGCPQNFGLADPTSELYVYQAYAQYLAPIFDGVHIKAGRFATLLGAEVAQTTQNFNVTRGNLYNLLQPIDHMGVLFTTPLGENLSLSAGVINGFATDDPDINEDKSGIAQIAWSGETAGVALSGIYGAETFGNDKNDRMTLDLVATWDPSEKFSAWLNADYAHLDPAGAASAEAWGVAVAGRYAITDRLGFSVRGEYVADDDGFFGFVDPNVVTFVAGGPALFADTTIWSVTGTLDYALTDNLTLRSEVRWDKVNKQNSRDGEFWDDGSSVFIPAIGPAFFTDLDDDQVVAGLEIIYEF